LLYLDAKTVAANLDRRRLIDALEEAFLADYCIPERLHYSVEKSGSPTGTLLIMSAWQAGRSLGVKVVTVFPGNADRGKSVVQAGYMLFDAASGTPQAVLDGTELTRRRTGAASALAARYLATPTASRLLVVGTGSLVPHIVESHAVVRPICKVKVWGRRFERAVAVAGELQHPRFTVEAVEDLESAVHWADIVSCVTASTTPMVQGAWLRPGQHLDLVGAFTPQMREVDNDAIVRSSVYVDTRAGALAESGELIHAMETGVFVPAGVRGDLRQLVRRVASGRKSLDEITLFKSVGSAVEDLAAAQLACSAAPNT
jgi:alanine dehydrogenase